MSKEQTMKDKIRGVLDEVVYPRLYFVRSFTSYRGEDDLEQLASGVNVELRLKDETLKPYLISEKEAFYYMNFPLTTFAFQIGYLKYNKFQPGWFINSKMNTTHYLLMWLLANEDYTLPDLQSKENKEKRIEQIKNFDVKDIRKMNFLLVAREKILNYLYACGIDGEGLEAFAAKMITEHLNDPDKNTLTVTAEEFLRYNNKPILEKYRNYLNFNVSFKINRNNWNRPVTMVLKRDFLEKKFSAQRFRLIHSTEEKTGWNMEILSSYDEEPLLPKYLNPNQEPTICKLIRD